MAAPPNIVLVHGAWADGSCWSSVIEAIQLGAIRFNDWLAQPAMA
jgi:hypothetical protein